MKLGELAYFADGEPLKPTIATNLSAADVWSVQTSGLTGTGTIGKELADVRGSDDDTLKTLSDQIDLIPDNVWDEASSGHTNLGTFGKIINTLSTIIGTKRWWK